MRDENGLPTTTQMEDEKNVTVEGKIDNDIKFGKVDRQIRNRCPSVGESFKRGYGKNSIVLGNTVNNFIFMT